MTTTVVPTTSVRPGQLTFFISTQTSRRKSRVVGHHSRIGFMSLLSPRCLWQGWRDSNPQPTVLETAALPIRATPLNFSFLVRRVLAAEAAILRELQLLGVGLLVLLRRVVPAFALGAREADRFLHGLLQNLDDGSGADGAAALADG